MLNYECLQTKLNKSKLNFMKLTLRIVKVSNWEVYSLLNTHLLIGGGCMRGGNVLYKVKVAVSRHLHDRKPSYVKVFLC